MLNDEADLSWLESLNFWFGFDLRWLYVRSALC
jgi:hypothetical protein